MQHFISLPVQSVHPLGKEHGASQCKHGHGLLLGNKRSGVRVSLEQNSMKARHPLSLALLALTGCIHHSGPVQYASESVELDNSEQVHVDLRMGAGDLRVSDGAQKLLRADFSYTVPSSKPEIRYTRDGNRGSLRIEQPG